MNPESPYPAGTLAIVRTPRFRCMAMLRENGEWIDVLHPECPLERPSVVEVIYRAPACGVGRAVKRVVAS